MHQTVGNILRTLLLEDPHITVIAANDLIDEALSIASHAMRTGVHTTLGSSPGSLVFNRDMFLNIPLIADCHLIPQRRENLVNYRFIRQNTQRRQYNYKIGQKVLKKLHKPAKLGQRTSGPFDILQVHNNGTIPIQLRPGVTERINIRRIIPFREDSGTERVTN